MAPPNISLTSPTSFTRRIRVAITGLIRVIGRIRGPVGYPILPITRKLPVNPGKKDEA